MGRKAKLTKQTAGGQSHFDLAIDYDINPKQIWRIVTGNPGVPLFNSPPMSDSIHNPDHYQPTGEGGIECVDAIRAALGEQGYMCFAAGNVMKYVWRASRKNGVEDLRKTSVYLEYDPAILGKWP